MLMTSIPPDAPRSEDGYYWWDGSDWQQVPDDERVTAGAATEPSIEPSTEPSTEQSAEGSGQSADGSMTPEELAMITDEEQLDERSMPYFQPDPDRYPDDDSAAEGPDVLSDEPAEAAGGYA
jgi:hypothetical protein